MRFFFDNNLAPKLARGLNIFVSPEHGVFHLRDKFSANSEDEVWIRQLAAEADWNIVTADVRIGKNPHEIKACVEGSGAYDLFSETGVDRHDFLGAGEQVYKVLSRDDRQSGKGEARSFIYCFGEWED